MQYLILSKKTFHYKFFLFIIIFIINDIFRFGPVLMRLALTLDKTDQVLELYLKEVKNK